MVGLKKGNGDFYMKKTGIIFFLILSMTFGTNTFGQAQQAIFSTQTIKKTKTGNQCEITLTNGPVQTMAWCQSPCQRMYGNLPGVKCP
jgi:hypothetical protein